MKIKTNIKTTNLELNSQIQNNIDEKVNHLEKFMNLREEETPILDIELENRGSHRKPTEVYRAELNLEYKGKVFRTESKGETVLLAFHEAQSEMVRQVRKNREKKIDLVRRGAAKIKGMLRFGRKK